MTAGSGIIHQEMPQPADMMLGVQLWLNLPKRDKMTKPAYRDITSEMIPKIEDELSKVSIIAGSYNSTNGATKGDYVNINFLDVQVKPEMEWQIQTEPSNTLFIYIVEGSGCFGEEGTEFESKRAILFEEGDTLLVRASDKGVRFLLLEGQPLKEPIEWGGPIVMNTKEELRQAFQEIKDGIFIKD